jgi:hypothetical protein
MHVNTSPFTRSVAAEAFKLKRTPLLWIAIIGGVFVVAFVFLIFIFNVEELSKSKENPWNMYFQIGFSMISLLLAVPYAILVTSSITYFEHHSNAWKYLYTLPLQKGNFYFSKLLLTTGLIALTYTVFLVCLLFTGYLLGFIHPSYQFQHQTLDFGHFLRTLGHSFLSILGITALHYWMSIRWKNFITPIGIGLLGFIIALFLLLAHKFEFALYLPYAYPGIIGYEMGIENLPTGIGQMGGLLYSEWLSIACFIVFSLIGFWEETTHDVK